MDEEREAEPDGIGVGLLMGGVSGGFGVVFGLLTMAVMVAPMPGLGWGMMGVVIVTEELLLAATVVCGLGAIRAVARPEWLERLLRSAEKKLIWCIAIASLPIVVMIVLAALGVKFGDVAGR